MLPNNLVSEAQPKLPFIASPVLRLLPTFLSSCQPFLYHAIYHHCLSFSPAKFHPVRIHATHWQLCSPRTHCRRRKWVFLSCVIMSRTFLFLNVIYSTTTCFLSLDFDSCLRPLPLLFVHRFLSIISLTPLCLPCSHSFPPYLQLSLGSHMHGLECI